MKCPACGAPDTQVRDSRPRDDDSQIRRRRRCAKCEHRFSTVELPSEEVDCMEGAHRRIMFVPKGWCVVSPEGRTGQFSPADIAARLREMLEETTA